MLGFIGHSQSFDWLIIPSSVVGVILAGLLGLLYAKQDNLLYMPNPPGFPRTPDENPAGFVSPGDWTTNGRRSRGPSSPDRIPYEDSELQTVDGASIHTWLLLQPNAAEVPTLLYFHGNAGNMGFRLKNAALMYSAAGINVLMMDYRGYGKSTGIPSEAGLNIDAETVMNYASNHPKLQGSPLIAFGRSLGGAVSVELAHRFPRKIKAVVVENTFLSIAAMVDRLMPYVSGLKSLILRIGWNSDVKIRDLEQPILFISGESDELVPPSHMHKLAALASRSSYKEFFSVPGGTHNDTWERAFDYYERLRQFLQIAVGTASKSKKYSTPAYSTSTPAGGNYDHDAPAEAAAALPTMRTNFQVR